MSTGAVIRSAVAATITAVTACGGASVVDDTTSSSSGPGGDSTGNATSTTSETSAAAETTSTATSDGADESSDDTDADLPCVDIDAPVCGDGKIGALEECDGSADCVDCRRDEARDSWFEAEDLASFVTLADGGVLTVGHVPVVVTRRDASGDELWSFEDPLRLSYASDAAASRIYGAGTQAVRDASFSYVEGRDTAGAIDWTATDPSPGRHGVIAVDAERVIVGGTTEQPNAATGRALLAQYATDGTPQWSRKIDDWGSIAGLATDGDEALVLGASLYPEFPWSIERVDAAGDTMWRVPLAPDLTPPPAAYGMTGDGSGGAWIFGDREAGAWAVRHDATGAEVDRIACVGDTTGWVTHMAVAPDGTVAIAVLVTAGPLPLDESRPWIAVLEDGEVTRGLAFGEDDRAERLFDLRWRADGRLVVGLGRSDPNEQHVLVVEP